MKPKRVVTLVLILSILMSMFCFPTTQAASTGVGTILNPNEIPEWVTDISNLRKMVVKEYLREIKLKSLSDNGVSYFDYGESTEELLHMENDSQISQFPYMIQFFKNGNSIDGGWSAIIVTEESYKKGEAYTLRDASTRCALPSATSAPYGKPLGNQFWNDGHVYQLFEEGYMDTYLVIDQFFNTYIKFRFYSKFEQKPPFTTGTEERYEYKYKGDMDGDEKITVTDVVELRRIILKAGIIAESVKVKGDTDGDFGITVSDVVELRRMIMKGA